MLNLQCVKKLVYACPSNPNDCRRAPHLLSILLKGKKGQSTQRIHPTAELWSWSCQFHWSNGAVYKLDEGQHNVCNSGNCYLIVLQKLHEDMEFSRPRCEVGHEECPPALAGTSNRQKGIYGCRSPCQKCTPILGLAFPDQEYLLMFLVIGIQLLFRTRPDPFIYEVSSLKSRINILQLSF